MAHHVTHDVTVILTERTAEMVCMQRRNFRNVSVRTSHINTGPPTTRHTLWQWR